METLCENRLRGRRTEYHDQPRSSFVRHDVAVGRSRAMAVLRQRESVAGSAGGNLARSVCCFPYVAALPWAWRACSRSPSRDARKPRIAHWSLRVQLRVTAPHRSERMYYNTQRV